MSAQSEALSRSVFPCADGDNETRNSESPAGRKGIIAKAQRQTASTIGAVLFRFCLSGHRALF
jgi:hypothetical protein